jgi:hypothetical protein
MSEALMHGLLRATLLPQEEYHLKKGP